MQIKRNKGLKSAIKTGWSYVSPFCYHTPEYLRNLDDDIRQYEINDLKGFVLLPVIPGWYRYSGYRQAVIGHAFKIQGYQPLFLANDNVLPICPGQMSEDTQKGCTDMCTQAPEELSTHFNIDIEYMSSNIDRELQEYTQILQETTAPEVIYENDDLTSFVLSSLRRHFKRHNLDMNNDEHKNAWKDFAVSAMMIKDATESVLSNYDVKTTIAFEETYIQGGVPLFCTAKEDITGYSIDWGYKSEQLIFGKTTNRQYLSLFSDEELLENVMSTELTSDEINAVEKTMSERMDGINTKSNYVAFEGNSIDAEGYDTVVGLFTNLIWDASLEAKEGAYSNPFEWLNTTIEWFSSQDNKLLVIKTHPAETLEGRHGTNQPVADWIYENYESLPENIIVLEPDADVNPYAMIADLDVGIVYNSIIGLEMAYEDLPVIVGGDPHYRSLGFTFDADDEKEYVEYLEQLPDGFDLESTSMLARRYAHYFFEQKHIPVQFYKSEGTYTRTMYPITHTELRDWPYDTIVQSMIAGKPVLKIQP